MNSRAYLLHIAFILLCLLSKTALSDQIAYPLCKQTQTNGREILYLSRESDTNCWKSLSGSSISGNDLVSKGGVYYFVYLFDKSDMRNDEFDPIFNVQSKILRNKDSEKLNSSIELYRKKMVTRCDRRIFNFFHEKFKFDEFARREMSGSSYNDYHNGKIRVTPAILDKFHIYFVDSLKRCRKTDSDDLLKYFAISDVNFEETSNLLAKIGNIFGISDAQATELGDDKYSQVSVEIGMGEFRGALLSGSFTLQADQNQSVIVNDLSTYSAYDYRLHRGIKFKIQDNSEE